jgi:hypothetical protein
MTMSKTTNHPPQPSVIVFGLTSIGKPKAGAFKPTEAEAARNSAAKLGLQVFEITDESTRAFAAKVPAGRIHGHGDAIVPFVPKALYTSIESLARPTPANPTKPNSPSQPPRPALPANWNDIKVGDRVLAQDSDPKDGWWQAEVVDRNGEIFKLRWPRSERGRPFQKHRLTLGLICPNEGVKNDGIESNKSPDSPRPRFPQDWAAIKVDQVVLAKEDGPCEQWWEAKTIKLDKDVFTLQWRDRPDLPSIERPRSTLGLVHPAPKAR